MKEFAKFQGSQPILRVFMVLAIAFIFVISTSTMSLAAMELQNQW